MEEYRDVKDHEGAYKVSDKGSILSLRRMTKGRYGNLKTTRGGLLKPHITHGYAKVELSFHGKSRAFFVHRLVAAAFIDNPHSYPCVNHVDNNKQNNEVSNLEWCTNQQNTDHMIRQGRHWAPSGKDHPKGKNTHCPRGHEFNDENTYWPPSGGRLCRPCVKINTANYRKRKSERKKQ